MIESILYFFKLARQAFRASHGNCLPLLLRDFLLKEIDLLDYPSIGNCSEHSNNAVMLLTASFVSENPCALSVDCLNSKTNIFFFCMSIATESGRLPQKRLTKRDNVVYWKTNGKINNDLQLTKNLSGLFFHLACWCLKTCRFSSNSCVFSDTCCSLHKLANSSLFHNVLILLPLSSVTNSSLLSCFFAACILSRWWWLLLSLSKVV